MQFYCNAASLIQLQNVHGWVRATEAELSNLNRDHMATNPEYLLFCTLQNKSVNPWVINVHLPPLGQFFILKSQRSLMNNVARAHMRAHKNPLTVHVGLRTIFSKWETLAILAQVFLFPFSSISYFGNFAHPHHLLLMFMTPSVLCKRSVTNGIYMRDEGNRKSSFTHPPSELLLIKSFPYCWTHVPMRLDKPDLSNLFLPSLREKPSLGQLGGVGDRKRNVCWNHSKPSFCWKARHLSK